MSKLIYVGLDFETDGISLRSLRPLQVGIVVDEPRIEYGTIIRYPRHTTVTAEQKKAQEIHGLTDEMVRTRGIEPHEVEGQMLRLLGMLAQNGTLVPVGYNVGNFDMQIMRIHFPLVHALFGHRVFDLNAVPFLLSGTEELVFETEKRVQNKLVRQRMEKVQEHDALSDAREAIEALHYQRYLIGE